MSIKLWIDDVRRPPIGEDWVHVETSRTAIEILSDCSVYQISFDHDLGDDDTTIPVAKFIEEMAYRGHIGPITWSVHSANPVGRANLIACLTKADEYWERNKS